MRWIVLTPEQAAKYRKYKITPWWGIDPIQTKDGRWVLREDQIGEIEDMKPIIQAQPSKLPVATLLQKIDYELARADVPIVELKTIKTIVELTAEDFPTEEEPIIKKL
jgi:hypothetical protein